MLEEIRATAQTLGYPTLLIVLVALALVLARLFEAIDLTVAKIKLDRRNRRQEEQEWQKVRDDWRAEDRQKKEAKGKHSAVDEQPTEVIVLPIDGRMKPVRHDTVDLSTLPFPRDEPYDYRKVLEDEVSGSSQGS